MNNHLRSMMAEMESWEAAAEFGIPEISWAEYRVLKRSDDLYVACLASIFDSLRIQQKDDREAALADIAKILVIYSRSAAAKYLSGVEKRLNQIYSAALYYIAGFPATATLLTRTLEPAIEPLEEESFLHGFLGRLLNGEHPLEKMLIDSLHADTTSIISDELNAIIESRISTGLQADPRQFIAAKLAQACLKRFEDTNVWDALRQFAAHYTTELWQPFLGSLRAFPLWELLPSQLTAIRAGLLGDTDETFSLQMPTSAGKTALCELIIYHEVKARHRRVLFLVPFRALAAEIRDGMSKRLTDAGVNVIASHGGNIPTRSESTTVENADVLIITPEKFTALTQVVPDIEKSYQTIICDEGHLIDDNSRGLQYELLLTKLRSVVGEPKKLIFISAILPNVNEIHEWLGGQPNRLALSNYKPVETDYAFLAPQPRSADSWQLDVNPIFPRPRSYFLLRFLVKDDFRYLNIASGRFKLVDGWKTNLSLACASALKARRNGSVALFTTSRGDNGIRGLAGKLVMLCECNALVAQNAPPISDCMPDLIEYIGFSLGQDYLLTRLLRFGAGFHHGMLPQEIRRVMEESIQDGVISILLCTTTLAEGVNLPIRTLVIHTVQRYNPASQSWKYLPNRNIKNIIGRVGRAGKETRGRVIFVNENERNQLLRVIRDQAMEPSYGALYRLVVAISSYITRTGITLSNDVIDRQTDSEFLSLIDSIDFTLLDLIPADTPQDQINSHIDELLERTLANRFCNTAQLRNALETIFRLRALKLKQSVSQENWLLLRKSGTSVRYLTFIEEQQLLEHPLWLTLDDSLDNIWINEVVIKLLAYPSIGINISSILLSKLVKGWMTGLTYAEISDRCSCDIDVTLEYICSEIGYRLQDHVAKLCQLAINKFGENAISETARNWSSLLQYGLKDMRQLDLFERGATDRLAVWGMLRLFEENEIGLRRDDLTTYIWMNGRTIRAELERDDRVPKMSRNRLFREMRI